MGSSVILPSPGQPKTGPDESFKSAAIPNVVSFGFEGIDPPASLYIQRDDVLVLEGFSTAIPETVTVFARVLIPLAPQPGQPDHLPAPPADPRGFIGPGYIQTFQQALPMVIARQRASLTLPLMEGYLLSVAVVATVATLRGQTFARVFLNRGNFSATAPNVVAMLLSDYVTLVQPVGWPGGRTVSSTEGPGFLTNYTPANPAAGADVSFLASNPSRTRLGAFSALFTASAGAANRIISVQYGFAGSTQPGFVAQDTVAVTASQVVRYTSSGGITNARGAGLGTAGNPIVVTLPGPSLALGIPGLVINTVTQNIQAGDQWSSIFIETEEWFETV